MSQKTDQEKAKSRYADQILVKYVLEKGSITSLEAANLCELFDYPNPSSAYQSIVRTHRKKPKREVKTWPREVYVLMGRMRKVGGNNLERLTNRGILCKVENYQIRSPFSGQLLGMWQIANWQAAEDFLKHGTLPPYPREILQRKIRRALRKPKES